MFLTFAARCAKIFAHKWASFQLYHICTCKSTTNRKIHTISTIFSNPHNMITHSQEKCKSSTQSPQFRPCADLFFYRTCVLKILAELVFCLPWLTLRTKRKGFRPFPSVFVWWLTGRRPSCTPRPRSRSKGRSGRRCP